MMADSYRFKIINTTITQGELENILTAAQKLVRLNKDVAHQFLSDQEQRIHTTGTTEIIDEWKEISQDLNELRQYAVQTNYPQR